MAQCSQRVRAEVAPGEVTYARLPMPHHGRRESGTQVLVTVPGPMLFGGQPLVWLVRWEPVHRAGGRPDGRRNGMFLSSPRRRLELPQSLRLKLLAFRRRAWAVKLAEAACGAAFGVLTTYLVTFALDR